MKGLYRESMHSAVPRAGSSLPLVLAFLLLVAPGSASGVTLDGSSRSYLRSGESISSADLRPGYEYLDLSIGDIGTGEYSAHFGGWGRYDFKQETGDTDIQYAYLSYKRRQDNVTINLGRTLVFEGVAAERIDGAYAHTDLAGNFGLSAFGGIPAETGINTAGNNILYGARLSHQSPDLYRVGISALKEEKNDATYREEEGVDLWLRPVQNVELLGRSSYDSVDDRWMEHAYNVLLGPFDRLRFNTMFSNYRYESYFRSVTNSALEFTSGLLDRNETSTMIGEEVSYAMNDNVTVHANYRHYAYKIAGNAQSFGGRVNYVHGKDTAAGFSAMRMDGDDARLRYTQYRLYAARMMGKMNIAIDLIDLVFDETASGTDNSYSATLALGYNVTRSLKIGADVEYRTSPLVDRDVLLFAKLIYRFGYKIGGGAS